MDNDKLHFVYSLAWNGIIFYIGCTDNVVKRYREHLHSHNKYNYKTPQFIKNILSNGQYPEINIIDYKPKKEAEKLERLLINSITSGGQALTNFQHSREAERKPKNIPSTITTKVMMKIVKYQQAKYIYYYQSRQEWLNKVPYSTDKYYPDEPFPVNKK